MISKRDALGRPRPGEYLNEKVYEPRIAPYLVAIGLEGFAVLLIVLVMVCLV